MNAPATFPTTRLDWAHAPSPYAWGVMIYGGTNPRTGREQPQMEVQFAIRQFGTGYTVEGILHRANDFAQSNHRTHFAVMNTDGSLLYAGPVLDAIEGPRTFERLSNRPNKYERAMDWNERGLG